MEWININHCLDHQFAMEKWEEKKNSCRSTKDGEQDSGSEHIWTCKVGGNCNPPVIV